jgi:PncC family amidohydrolase
MVQFIHWVKEEIAAGNTLSELAAAEKADYYRSMQEGFCQTSFDTIAGYGPNAALPHYAVSEESNLKLKPEGFLLVDSGGQYTDGTTDITRTIALGPLTEEMKLHYTLVLKGHISLATARFEEGTTGAELDKLARGPLLEKGLNVTTAESCTGGLIAKRLTDIAGSSAAVVGGFVTYQTHTKTQLLGVPADLIEKHGVVSAETAKAMAEGARAALGADIAIATTGYAGPGGGDAENPVGTVYIAVASRERTAVRRFSASSLRDRAYIRTVAATNAILDALHLLCDVQYN